MSTLRFLLPRRPFNIPKHVPRRISPQFPRYNSTLPTPKDTSLSGKLKELSRKYGKAAIGVYLGISLIDYAFAFLLVHQLGATRIAAYEDSIYRKIRQWTGKEDTMTKIQQSSRDVINSAAETIDETFGTNYEEPRKSGIWTEAVIAYGIHKALFIFIRVPVTVAITPSIVKTLVKRGWKIGPAAVK